MRRYWGPFAVLFVILTALIALWANTRATNTTTVTESDIISPEQAAWKKANVPMLVQLAHTCTDAARGDPSAERLAELFTKQVVIAQATSTGWDTIPSHYFVHGSDPSVPVVVVDEMGFVTFSAPPTDALAYLGDRFQYVNVDSSRVSDWLLGAICVRELVRWDHLSLSKTEDIHDRASRLDNDLSAYEAEIGAVDRYTKGAFLTELKRITAQSNNPASLTPNGTPFHLPGTNEEMGALLALLPAPRTGIQEDVERFDLTLIAPALTGDHTDSEKRAIFEELVDEGFAKDPFETDEEKLQRITHGH